MNPKPKIKALHRINRAQALLQTRRLCREQPYLVIAKHRDEIIVARWCEIFDGWEKYGRQSYPRKHTECYVTRAGVTGKNWTRQYRSIKSIRADYPIIDRRFRADEQAEARSREIINGNDEASLYKTLHLAADGTLQSPFDGSRWEIGVPRTTEMAPVRNGNDECSSGGFFALDKPEEWNKYPPQAATRTDRLVVVECIARDVERLSGKFRARTLCPVGMVLGISGVWYNQQVHVA